MLAEKKRRGFASMSSEKQREIASRGGRAAHEKGRAHEFTVEEAKEAGRKGGLIVSQNRDHMAQIGREGGHARALRAVRFKPEAEQPPIQHPSTPQERVPTEETLSKAA